MGAWGYEPFDSDDAMDFIGLIEEDVCKHIAKALTVKRTFEHQAVAAAGLLLKLTERKSLVNLSYHAMNWSGRRRLRSGKHSTLFGHAAATIAVIEASGWIATWDDPAKMQKTLRSLIRQLKHRETLQRKADEQFLKSIVVRRNPRHRTKRKRRLSSPPPNRKALRSSSQGETK